MDSRNLSNLDLYLNGTIDADLQKLDKISCNLNIFFSLVGVIFNILSIYAFSQKKLRARKYNWYLLVLAVFELVFCITLFVDYIFAKVYREPIFFHELNEFTRILVDFTIHTSDSCTAILSLILSLDRLYAIKYPLDIKQFFTNLHAKITIAASISIFMLLNTASFAFCQLNIGISLFLSKPFYFLIIYIGNNPYLIFCKLISPALLGTIPLIVVFLLNIMLIKEVIKSNKTNSNQRASIDSKRSETTFTEMSCTNKSSFFIELRDMKRKTSDYGTTKLRNSQIDCLVLFNVKSSAENSPRTSIEPINNLKINTETSTPELLINLSHKRNNLRPSLILNSDCIKRKNLQTLIRSNNRKSEMSKSQKSHYFVIMTSNIWSVISSIPYSIFSYYLAVLYLHCGKEYGFEFKITSICQVVSSILFNSNHSTNFFIYISFYKEFQDCFKNLLKIKFKN